jgi:hypothetical protein
MVDIDKLLMGEDPAPKKRDRVDDLLEGTTPVKQFDVKGGIPDRRPLDGLPRPGMPPVSGSEAGIGTQIESKQVDDLQTKIGIFSKKRGIPSERYGVFNGRIVYQGDDGKLYFEEPDTKTIGGLAKDVIATSAGHPEELAMGTILSPLGPVGAALGAAGGAGIRKVRGNLMYNEPQTSLGNVAEMGVAGGTSALGQYMGGKLIKGIDTLKGKQGAQLIEAAGRGANRISLPETQRIEQLGAQRGIKLIPPQTTRSPELISRFNILGDLPETADLIGAARRKQNEQVVTAIDDFLTSISPATSPGEAGRRGVEAAKGGISAANTVRQSRATPFYERSFSTGTQVDVEPIINLIDQELKTAKGPIFDGLQNAKKLLMRPDLPKTTGPSILINPSGQPLVPATQSFETSLQGLHGTKMALDDIIANAKQTGLGNTVKRNYIQIKEKLLQQMDAASPDYKKARAIFAQESIIPEELSKTKIAEIAKLEGDKVERVAGLLFSPTQSSVEQVAIAKPIIIKEGGEDAWNALIRVHMQNALSKVKESATGGITNVGGHFRKAMFGDPSQRVILKEAMSPVQFRNFEQFSEVLDRTGLILGKESTTATRQYQLQAMKEEALPLGFKYAEEMVNRPWNPFVWIGGPQAMESLRRTLFEKSNERLANAMLSDKAARQLQSLLQLKPASRELIKRFSTFMAGVAGGEFEEKTKEAMRPTIMPPSTKRTQGKLVKPGVMQ